MQQSANVLIFGGGPAGSATALRLCKHGYKPTIVERSAFQAKRVGETLLPAGEGYLRSLGVWDRFEREQFKLSPGIASAWGSENLTQSSFLFQPFSAGWHLDRVRFDRMLLDACRECGCNVMASTGPINISRVSQRWEVAFASLSCRADWLVDATGRAASVATRQDASRIAKDRLMALVGYADEPKERLFGSQLLVESARKGWWYSAGLPDGRLVVAFLTDADMLPRHVEDRLVLWNSSMRETHHTIKRIRSPDSCGPLRLVNANTSRLDQVEGQGWLAVGDAAIALDPLSGNGIIRAMQTGMAAAEAIMAGGDPSSLKIYIDLVSSIASDNAVDRRDSYNREKRWDHPFWQRRWEM